MCPHLRTQAPPGDEVHYVEGDKDEALEVQGQQEWISFLFRPGILPDKGDTCQ